MKRFALTLALLLAAAAPAWGQTTITASGGGNWTDVFSDPGTPNSGNTYDLAGNGVTSNINFKPGTYLIIDSVGGGDVQWSAAKSISGAVTLDQSAGFLVGTDTTLTIANSGRLTITSDAGSAEIDGTLSVASGGSLSMATPYFMDLNNFNGLTLSNSCYCWLWNVQVRPVPAASSVLNTALTFTGSGTYVAPNKANVYGNFGAGSGTVGTITGSFSNGTAFNVTPGSLATGYVVPSAFASSVTGSLAGGISATGNAQPGDVWSAVTFSSTAYPTGGTGTLAVSPSNLKWGTVVHSQTGTYAGHGPLSAAHEQEDGPNYWIIAAIVGFPLAVLLAFLWKIRRLMK